MKKTLLLSIFIFLSYFIHANGDPVTSASALIASASPTPRKIVDIQLVREDLQIKPGNYTYVTVKYELHNRSSKDYTNIDYAFPVDYMGGGDKYLNSGWQSDCCSESSFVLGWKDKYIKEIHFAMNGKSLASKISDEVKIGGPDRKPKLNDFKDVPEEELQHEYDDALLNYDMQQTYRRWFYTQFSIKAGETAILEVRYALYNDRTRGAIQGRFGEYAGSTCRLQYDMSPAQNWGNGKAESFYAKVDASGLSSDPSFFEPPKEAHFPPNITISGLPFKQNQGIFTYQTKNFNFKECEPIGISYSLINDEEIETIAKHRISPELYTITATDEVEQYPVSNLSDMSPATAWVATKVDGINQKLIIKLNQPTEMRYIVLVNGYHKSKTSYEQNNRVKRLTCRYKYNYTEASGASGGDSQIVTERVIEITDYKELNNTNFRNHPDILAIDLHSWGMEITEIVLEIQDVYFGSKYHDTCISEVVLLKDF